MKSISKWFLGILFVLGMSIGLASTEAGYTNYSYPYNHNYASNTMHSYDSFDQPSSTIYPVIDSRTRRYANPYQDRDKTLAPSNYDCLMYGYCQTPPSSYSNQTYPHADNSINHSFNTTNHNNIEYTVKNDYHYDYKYNYEINNSYNQMTQTPPSVVKPSIKQPAQPIIKQPIIKQPTPNPVTPTPTKPSPTYCSAQYQPVCGHNQATYANSCVAQQAGVSIACQGTCPCQKPTPIPPTYQCQSGETMVRSQNQCFEGYGSVCYQRPDHKRCTRKGTTPPPEKCDQQPEQICTTHLRSKRGDTSMSQLGLTIPSTLKHIKSYRIQRFNGTRSQWYTPGDNDIDWKNNCQHTTQTTNCARRVRSYFDDHNYEIKTCTIQYPHHNSCTQQNYFYPSAHTQNQHSNTTRPQSQPHINNTYAIQRYYGPRSSQTSQQSATHQAPSSQSHYGRDEQASYFANPRTYGIADVVQKTFR